MLEDVQDAPWTHGFLVSVSMCYSAGGQALTTHLMLSFTRNSQPRFVHCLDDERDLDILPI